MTEREEAVRSNFIWDIIEEDIRSGRVSGPIHTRLPPEPNGYLHIGHAKNIYINAGTAQRFNGICNLRFDDTNPAKEDVEYVEAIQYDIHWLGYDWNGGLFFGSMYFDQCYELAEKLIQKGMAFVCDLSQEEMRQTRGTLTQPGQNSPYRERSVEENLDLFRRMRAGEFADGARVLRAKIDMASPNINMRDPVMYRIMHKRHHQTGDKWCIYPMYDFAHPIQDAIEGITHSMCSLEYEDHRPLYDWVIEACEFPNHPRQIESARLNLTRTVMSKRYLRQLVETGLVRGWDDPRMPTLAGLRRRGYTAASIRSFIEQVGVAKANSVVDVAFLEHCIREDLNDTAPRRMAVLDPIKVILTNYPQGQQETVTVQNHPAHPEWGARELTFTRELFIEREDFMMDPPKKFFRLAPGREVRLKDAYIIRCESAELDENGQVRVLYCTYDADTRSGSPGAERKVKGTLHWLSAADAVPAEIRLYDYLLKEDDDPSLPFEQRVNPDSMTVLRGALVEPSLAGEEAGKQFQFLRQGYYVSDPDGTKEKPVFNQVVGLKDSWAKAK